MGAVSRQNKRGATRHERGEEERIMDQTQKLLQSIVENSRMGEDACDQLLQRAQDAALRQELMREKEFYGCAARDAENKLCAMGAKPHPKGPMARMGLWMGMQMNTAMDTSASHLADIVIQGATMGVVELTKARNSNPDADAEAHGIAANLITRQQESIDRLKAFLREKVVVK